MQDAQLNTLPGNSRLNSGTAMACEPDTNIGNAKNRPPLVSIIIPTYNCAEYLEDAVKSAFAQTYSPLECIVVDDGSTDHTGRLLETLARKYPFLITARKENGGTSSARNMGLQLSSGDFVSFLDADDVMVPDKIARQVECLNAHGEVGIVYGDYLMVSESLQPLAVFAAEMPRDLHVLDSFCYRNWFNPSVTLIRRTVIDKVGDFDEALAVAEDWDYWIRCAKVARISYVAGAVALYRQHGGQTSRDYTRMRRSCIQVARKSFGGNGSRLRIALASIEWTYAKYLWNDRARARSLVALLTFGVRHRFGLRTGDIFRQLTIMTQSQLRPLESTAFSGIGQESRGGPTPPHSVVT